MHIYKFFSWLLSHFLEKYLGLSVCMIRSWKYHIPLTKCLVFMNPCLTVFLLIFTKKTPNSRSLGCNIEYPRSLLWTSPIVPPPKDITIYNRLGMETRGNAFGFESVIEISIHKLSIIPMLQIHTHCRSRNSLNVIVMVGSIFEDLFFNWKSNPCCLTESCSHLCKCIAAPLKPLKLYQDRWEYYRL